MIFLEIQKNVFEVILVANKIQIAYMLLTATVENMQNPVGTTI